jgi:hypothetical protein
MLRHFVTLVKNTLRAQFGTSTARTQPRNRRRVPLTLEVLECREVPTVTVVSPGNQLNFDGDQVSLAVSASDSGGATLSYSATGLPAGLGINANSGEISGTVATNADASGPYTTTITASNGTDSASQTVVWEVDYPVGAVNPADQTGFMDSSQVNLPIHATDAAGGTLTYSATGLPAGLGIDSNTGIISGTISSIGGVSTTYNTTVTVGDGTYSDSTTFKWVVNNPVVFVHTSDQANNNGDQVSLQVYASNANSGTLTYSATDLPDGLTINAATGVISGTIATAADSAFVTTATVTATDGTFTATQTFTWTVSDPLSVTNPGGQSNLDGDQLSLQISAADTTGGTLTYSATGLPTGLTIDGQPGHLTRTESNA